LPVSSSACSQVPIKAKRAVAQAFPCRNTRIDHKSSWRTLERVRRVWPIISDYSIATTSAVSLIVAPLWTAFANHNGFPNESTHFNGPVPLAFNAFVSVNLSLTYKKFTRATSIFPVRTWLNVNSERELSINAGVIVDVEIEIAYKRRLCAP